MMTTFAITVQVLDADEITYRIDADALQSNMEKGLVQLVRVPELVLATDGTAQKAVMYAEFANVVRWKIADEDDG